MNRLLATCLVSLSLAALPLVASADAKSDATIDISGRTVAAGVGFTDAKGTVHYGGKSYPVQVQGVGIAQVGVSTFTATGEVTNLKQLQDIDGNYTAESAGATLAGGSTESTMTNPNGVVVRMHSTNARIDRLTLGGVLVKLLRGLR